MVVSVKASYIIKPCSDTPNVVMPVSECDQMHRLSHSRIIYFYRSGNNPFNVDSLKDSLSKALVIFYPIAGRLRWLSGGGGRVEIHCNSDGAVLLEAESESTVDDYGDFRPSPELQPLIPTVDYANTPLQDQPLLLAQFTRFACGGIGFGFALSHVLADGQSTFRFIRTWARIARGEEPDGFPFLDRKVLDLLHQGWSQKYRSTPVQHPVAQAIDISKTEFAPPPSLIGNLDEPEKETGILALKLSKDNLRKLRDMAANKDVTTILSCGRSYSRFEVVSAHIWRCATKAQRHRSEQPTNLYFPLDVRSRLKPPLPTNYFGNGVLRLSVSATSGELQKSPLSYAASRIREVIDKATHEYLSLNLAFYKQLPDISSFRYYTDPNYFYPNPNFRVVSWTNLPIFGMDFGWGKEIYVGPGEVIGNGRAIIIPDQVDEGSLKVILRLQKDHIDAFENLFNSMNIFTNSSL